VKVTKDIVTPSTGMQNNDANMQTDVAMQPSGSVGSGGPVLDEVRNVIGIRVVRLETKVALEKFDAILKSTNVGVTASVAKAMLSTFEIDLGSGNGKEMPRSEMGGHQH
jgi:hypothetical protein